MYKRTCERVTLSSILGHGNKGYGMDALSFDSNSNTFQGLYSRKLLDKDQNEEKKILKTNSLEQRIVVSKIKIGLMHY